MTDLSELPSSAKGILSPIRPFHSVSTSLRPGSQNVGESRRQKKAPPNDWLNPTWASSRRPAFVSD